MVSEARIWGEGHPGARHQLKFFGGVVVIDVADIGAKEDLTAGGRVGVKFTRPSRSGLVRFRGGDVSEEIDTGVEGDLDALDGGRV